MRQIIIKSKPRSSQDAPIYLDELGGIDQYHIVCKGRKTGEVGIIAYSGTYKEFRIEWSNGNISTSYDSWQQLIEEEIKDVEFFRI